MPSPGSKCSQGSLCILNSGSNAGGKRYKHCRPIRFVGLIVPHVSRIVVGYDNRILIPVSGLLGSIFTLLCDLLARVLFAPFEIPVGIIMSFLGGPFFIYLLIKGRRGLLYD